MSPDDPASPACLAHEADDAYMGFASREEIGRFLMELESAADRQKVEMLRRMLPRIRDDTLHRVLSTCLATITDAESKT